MTDALSTFTHSVEMRERIMFGKTVKNAAISMSRAFFAKGVRLFALFMILLTVKMIDISITARITAYNIFILTIIS
jgi:hypothetical protein